MPRGGTWFWQSPWVCVSSKEKNYLSLSLAAEGQLRKMLQFTFCSIASQYWRWGESGDYIFRCDDHDQLLWWSVRTNNGQPWKKAKLVETTNYVVAPFELQPRLVDIV